MMMLAALAMAMQYVPSGQDRVDNQIEQRVQQELRGGPPPVQAPMQDQPMQGPPVQPDTGQVAPQDMREPPSKNAVKALGKRLEQVGDLYEAMGHCAGSMTPAEVETTLREAQAQQAGPYLLGRYERGFRKPKDDAWCYKQMGRLDK